MSVPSWRSRAALAVALLAAFHVCTLTLALLLFATAPTLLWLARTHRELRSATGTSC